ncbi:hypothetical protein EC973_007901 [Apophysomyces ossiformis]|uniref:T4 RNA ligase 1-like N-terminal domain-containing protein n=1 Tax=Apophysomyces ossiformis TaxID=679940 RepID=A0A8H7BU66_9FUNG|nr:hypothetical protein EC973_007901 [Apophysomyces ossiformis]
MENQNHNVTIPPVTLSAVEADDHTVIQKLYQLEKSHGKELRYKSYDVDDATWVSWTMREHVYKKKQSTYPTMARGLFTTKENNQYKIVARGYDKFFNVNETAATQWSSLEKETTGPYEVTVKENGCIIFIAAVNERSVVVTSKHSIPDQKDDMSAHGGVGYCWLIKHLESVGKTEKELAKWLLEKNITLVAELCDDTFEEHILPYPEKESGLYLHGINYNTAGFHTVPIHTVRQVAETFGMRTISYKVHPDILTVKKFAEEIQRTRLYQNREVEGIVVRCKRNGQDFFYKIKNEHYLIFREYREVTKALLHVSSDGAVSIKKDKVPKCHYEKTRYYIQWLRRQVPKRPELFQSYTKNKNIVAVRKAFEKEWETGRLNFGGDPAVAVETIDHY